VSFSLSYTAFFTDQNVMIVVKQFFIVLKNTLFFIYDLIGGQ